MAISRNCEPNRRCRICGKPDFCNWIEFQNGDTLECCYRVSGKVNDTTVGKDGQVYMLKHISIMGFYVWEPPEQNERNWKEYREMIRSESNWIT